MNPSTKAKPTTIQTVSTASISRSNNIDITILCKSLQQVPHQFEEDSIGINFFSTNDISDQKILLELEYNDKSLYGLITYCRDKYSNNQKEIENIQKFEQEYGDNSPRWWHTYECFHLSYG
ncbi:unnamed protein product [Rotaria sordida]|uniref:Uncharacterized protein n=1 Tax=Rotaria sordida TaxID=392033 RepID=A0A814L019_9BILA|nr:unnamed protein product [Rotaria sordida]CAF1465201.1 unnamed protein product [Rotaria sordida]